MENPIRRTDDLAADTARRVKAAGGAGGAMPRSSASRLFFEDAVVEVSGRKLEVKGEEFGLLKEWADGCRAAVKAGLEIRAMEVGGRIPPLLVGEGGAA